MEIQGIDWMLLGFQFVNLLLLIAWIGLAVVALRRLAVIDKPWETRVLWGIVIVVLPLIGASLFIQEHPRTAQREERQ